MNDIASLARLRAAHETVVHDSDPQETAEWCDALDSVVAAYGPARARYLLDVLAQRGQQRGIGWSPTLATPYVNTVAASDQPAFPGDLAIECADTGRAREARQPHLGGQLQPATAA